MQFGFRVVVQQADPYPVIHAPHSTIHHITPIGSLAGEGLGGVMQALLAVAKVDGSGEFFCVLHAASVGAGC